ncbi:MAG: PAS domain S-box protein [bacterium]|nr:PAS domain S-box protein [bacterium]
MIKGNTLKTRLVGFLDRLSIKRKLVLIIMLVSSAAILLAGGAFTTYQWIAFRHRMVHGLSVQAEMVAANCTGALSFNVPKDAVEVLDSLKARESIELACVYRNNGSLFARYRRKDFNRPAPPAPQYESYRFDDQSLVMTKQVTLNGQPIGMVYLQSDLSELDSFLRQSALALALMLLLPSILAYILSSRLQGIISRPLSHLAKVAGHISRHKDYSMRADKKSEDEFGRLTDAFNDMLDQVERRDKVLRHLRNLLSNIVNSMPSVLVGVDKSGRVTQWNREAERLTGIMSNDAQDRPLSDVFPQLAVEMERVRLAIRKREAQKNEKVPSEMGGETRFSDITVYPLISNGVEGAVIRMDDVTERVRIEEMMIQTEKMLSVGGLAAGMAHEINNPLAGILQNTQVMRNRVMDDIPKNTRAAEECGTSLETVRAYMEKRGLLAMMDTVMESGRRAAKIVENMLSFSRKSESYFKYNNLGELLDKTVDLACNDYDLKKKYDFRKVKIIREYEKDLPKVLCEGSRIQQVLLNILKNGAQAMALTKNPHFILRVMPDYDMVRMEIVDNGPGMDQKTQKRIFEPFFTTKPVGTGTGLGLSVSYFIITENHQGTMAVASTPGVGTKFIIRLPINPPQK